MSYPFAALEINDTNESLLEFPMVVQHELDNSAIRTVTVTIRMTFRVDMVQGPGSADGWEITPQSLNRSLEVPARSFVKYISMVNVSVSGSNNATISVNFVTTFSIEANAMIVGAQQGEIALPITVRPLSQDGSSNPAEPGGSGILAVFFLIAPVAVSLSLLLLWLRWSRRRVLPGEPRS